MRAGLIALLVALSAPAWADSNLPPAHYANIQLADPAKGSIAYTSPMARALLGRKKGDFAEAPGGGVEIVALEFL